MTWLLTSSNVSVGGTELGEPGWKVLFQVQRKSRWARAVGRYSKEEVQYSAVLDLASVWFSPKTQESIQVHSDLFICKSDNGRRRYHTSHHISAATATPTTLQSITLISTKIFDRLISNEKLHGITIVWAPSSTMWWMIWVLGCHTTRPAMMSRNDLRQLWSLGRDCWRVTSRWLRAAGSGSSRVLKLPTCSQLGVGSKSWKSKKWFSAKIGLGICIPTLLFCIETSLMIWRLSLCTILLHKRLPIMSSSKNTWDYGRIWTWFVLIGPNPDLHTKKQYVE